MKHKIKGVDVAIIVTLILLVAALLSPLFLPASDANAYDADTNGDGQVTLEDYVGKKVGSITGVNYDDYIAEHLPGSTVEYYSNYPDLVVAMKSGLIECFMIDEPALAYIMMQDPEVGCMPDNLGSWPMSFAFHDKAVRDQMNEFISMSREDGVLDEIHEIWFGRDEERKVIPPLDSLNDENGTIRVAMETTYAPIVYLKDQQIVGFEVDLLYRFCEHYHYGLELMDMLYDAVLPAVVTGKCDIGASGLVYDEEHADSVPMSDPHLMAGTSLAVPASVLAGNGGQNDQADENSLKELILKSVNKNLIEENRWQLIVRGIGTTCLITLLSAVTGSLLAFGMCLLRRTDSNLANPLCDSFIHIMQGVPMVVLLMILFYVVFSDSHIASVWVAVIGFAMCFGANAGVIMQSGLDSVDPGQEEAALSLGYTRNQAFYRFLYPQAAVNFLPVYRGELVKLLNDTSIVGYIAVQDLTKMSDIIRSRSYEAFLPLILTTLIYFLLARIIMYGIDRLLEAIRPKRRNSTAGGDAV